MEVTISETNQYRLPTTGEKITIQGLVSAAQHNGKIGRVLKYDKETGRYGIQIEVGEGKKKQLAIKPTNILLSDDKNKKEWDDRLVHVFVPCHTSDRRRHEQFRQCGRSLAVQVGRCRIFVSVSGELRDEAVGTLRTAAALPKPVGGHHQWFVMETSDQKSQFQHFQSLFPISMALNPCAWLMFLDNDDMYHPFRVRWFQDCAKKIRDNLKIDGFYSGGKLLIDEMKVQEKFGDDDAVNLDLFLNLDDSLNGIVDVAATIEENSEKDVIEYFDYCIRSKVMKKFLSVTPQEILSHPFCDVRFGVCIQQLNTVTRYHPTEEWLLMHYRVRHLDRHQLFLNRDMDSRKNAMVSVTISEEDRALSEETGLDEAMIAFCRKDIEEGAIMMVERDDAGLEHRRKMLVPGLDREHGSEIGTRIWQATWKKFSAYFTAELAKKNRQWYEASNRQNYSLEQDLQQDSHY